MQITTPRELCALPLPSGPIVVLYQEDGRFFTEQQFDDGNAATIELPTTLDAFRCYQYAREHGRIRAPFPVPVADEEPDPPEQTFAAKARRIRVRAGVSVRDLAAEVGVKSDTIKVWETESSESPW